MYSSNIFLNERISTSLTEDISKPLAEYIETFQNILVGLNDVNYINLCLDFQLLYYLTKVEEYPNKDILHMILNDISLNLLLIENIDQALGIVKEIPDNINKSNKKCKNNRKIFAVHDALTERRNLICKYTRINRIGK